MTVNVNLPDGTTLPASALSGVAPIVASVAVGSAAVTTTEGASNGAGAQVAVTTTATLIAAARVGRKSILLQNLGATDVWIGFSNAVAATNGLLLPAGRGQGLALDGGAAIYGVVASGAQTISVAEFY